MEALFLKLVNLSVMASLLVLAVLLLRLIFRKAPRWIFCLLWGLVALRLICPVSLESALSLIPSAETIPTGIAYEAAQELDSSAFTPDQAMGSVAPEASAPEGMAVANSGFNPLRLTLFLASRLWLLGLAAMLVYSAVSFLLLKRRLRTATLLRDNIRQSEQVNSPFVLGFFRPVIFLPYSVSGEDIGHVVAHEQAHIKRRDHWWKPIGFLILSVYWFNPLMWLAYVLFCRDIELACDEKVVANMEKDARRAYSTALLNCSVRRRIITACPLAFGETGVKGRVKNVMNYKKPAFWIVIVALLACAAAAVCFLTVPKSPGDSWILAEDGSGMPAPKGGPDPYADLEPAERAAAFLKNADSLDYELSPILMYGQYIIPVMEYVPVNQIVPDSLAGMFDRTETMLELLHSFDLSALEPHELTRTDLLGTESGVIRVGDARCRVAVWYYATPSESNQGTDTALVFTFTDGTMCAFSGGALGRDVSDIIQAISFARDGQVYTSGTGGNMTVTQLVTGESRVSSPVFSGLIECIFDNTVLLSEPVKDTQGSFDFQVSFEDGATYLFDCSSLLIKTEGGQVYAIGGFEGSDGSITYEAAITACIQYGFDAPENQPQA